MNDPQSQTPRDADWCDAMLAAGGVIYRERIHLTRKLKKVTEGGIVECRITQDFDGWFIEGDAPKIVASWSAETGLLLPGGSW